MPISTKDRLISGLVQTDSLIQRSARLSGLPAEKAAEFSAELDTLRNKAREVEDADDDALLTEDKIKLEQCMMDMQDLHVRILQSGTPTFKW